MKIFTYLGTYIYLCLFIGDMEINLKYYAYGFTFLRILCNCNIILSINNSYCISLPTTILRGRNVSSKYVRIKLQILKIQ